MEKNNAFLLETLEYGRGISRTDDPTYSLPTMYSFSIPRRTSPCKIGSDTSFLLLRLLWMVDLIISIGPILDFTSDEGIKEHRARKAGE
jgi:hypothetical protein